MSDQNEHNKIKKIVVNSEHELTDIISQIKESASNYLILTFAQPTDILVSPVNFRVLQDVADENDKTIIAQIIQNPTGSRNATDAGVTVYNSVGSIADDIWEQAEDLKRKRIAEREKLLKSGKHQSVHIKGTVINDNASDQTSPEDPVSMDETAETNTTLSEQAKETMSDFQKSVKKALDRSKDSNKPKTVQAGGVALALDSEIQATSTPNNNSFIGKDFIGKQQTHSVPTAESRSGTPMQKISLKGSPQSVAKEKFEEFTKWFKKQNHKKIFFFAGLPTIILIALALWYWYSFTPEVEVEIFIESRPVSVEQTFTGNTDVDEIDIEDTKIPVRSIQTIEKSKSGTANATGVDVRGTQAGGIITLKCFLDGTEIIPSGTTLTTEDGLQFILVNDVSLTCPGFTDATVTAAAVGSEYNISSDKFFSVAGYTSDQINATNITSFSGGTSEEFKVISEDDIKTLAEDLESRAKREAREEMNSTIPDGWEIIESTIKHEVVDGVQTDVPAGTEADVVNVEVNTRSTALYYNKAALEDSADDILIASAVDQELFESEDDLNLELNENDIETDITVVEVVNGQVTVRIKTSGAVKPEVSTSNILDELGGLGWDEGLAYLEDLDFVSAPSTVVFSPDGFPQGLRYFPDSRSRLQITVTEVEAGAGDSSESE